MMSAWTPAPKRRNVATTTGASSSSGKAATTQEFLHPSTTSEPAPEPELSTVDAVCASDGSGGGRAAAAEAERVTAIAAAPSPEPSRPLQQRPLAPQATANEGTSSLDQLGSDAEAQPSQAAAAAAPGRRGRGPTMGPTAAPRRPGRSAHAGPAGVRCGRRAACADTRARHLGPNRAVRFLSRWFSVLTF